MIPSLSMKLMLIATSLILLSCTTVHAQDYRQWSEDATIWLGKRPSKQHVLSAGCIRLRFDKPYARAMWQMLLKQRSRLAVAVRDSNFGEQLRVHRAMTPLVKKLRKKWFRMPAKCRWVAPAVIARR